MNLIVAVDSRWGIGNKGDLLAHVRADLKNFSKITTGHTVVYGSKTLSTFPGGRVLKNRSNIILSTRQDFCPEGGSVVHSVEELLEKVKNVDPEEVFVIGGARTYTELLPYCDVAFVTKFDKAYESDAWIPNLDESGEWTQVYRSQAFYSDPEKDDDPDLRFFFTKYRRIGGKTEGKA